LAAFDIGFLRVARSMRPSLIAIAMLVPLSLLLYLWMTTPTVTAQAALYVPGAGTLVRPAVFLAAWMLMTTAMMLPSAMPLLVSFDRMARNHTRRHEMSVFAALAYMAVWGLVGVAAWVTSAAAGHRAGCRYGADEAQPRELPGGAIALHRLDRAGAGGWRRAARAVAASSLTHHVRMSVTEGAPCHTAL